MLALSRKNMVLLLILVSLVAVVISMSAIHAANPAVWHHLLSDGPDIISHF